MCWSAFAPFFEAKVAHFVTFIATAWQTVYFD